MKQFRSLRCGGSTIPRADISTVIEEALLIDDGNSHVGTRELWFKQFQASLARAVRTGIESLVFMESCDDDCQC